VAEVELYGDVVLRYVEEKVKPGEGNPAASAAELRARLQRRGLLTGWAGWTMQWGMYLSSCR